MLEDESGKPTPVEAALHALDCNFFIIEPTQGDDGKEDFPIVFASDGFLQATGTTSPWPQNPETCAQPYILHPSPAPIGFASDGFLQGTGSKRRQSDPAPRNPRPETRDPQPATRGPRPFAPFAARMLDGNARGVRCNLQWWNAKGVTWNVRCGIGHTREEITGKSPTVLHGPETNQTVVRQVWRHLAQGRVWMSMRIRCNCWCCSHAFEQHESSMRCEAWARRLPAPLLRPPPLPFLPRNLS